jgi:hypothetical protein
MKTERGDMMREVLKRIHDYFEFDPVRDGPFCVTPLQYTDSAFLIRNVGRNAGGSLSKFIAFKSGWYTEPERWIFEAIR